jgi:hypothetical protein
MVGTANSSRTIRVIADMDRGQMFKEASGYIKKGLSMFDGGPLEFYLTEMAAAYEMLMTRFAPFRVGDKVVLVKKLDIKSDSGWFYSRHFLIVGALGVVRHAECGTSGFKFDVEFDNETWIDKEGNENPISQKHSFRFGESSLAAVREISE